MFIVKMEWQIVHLGRECPELLISDDLLARSNGIGVGLGHMAMPISPQRLLILANNTTTLKAIQAMSARKMATEMNRWTVEGARHFVASTNRAQERFIRNRFGASLKPSIFDNLDRIDELYASGDVMRTGIASRAADRSGGGHMG